MKKLPLFMLAATLAAVPALAFPGGPGDRPSSEERAAERVALFTAADADGDGTLTIDEFTAFTELAHAARLERRFSSLDQDSNGVIAAEELENGDHPRPRRGRR